MHLRTRLAAFVFAAAFAVPSLASAQRAGSEADRLFNEGKRLMGQQRFAQACEMFAQSDKLESTIGAIGLLAACHERQGLWASAYREYLETARRADEAGDPRGQYARDRANALRPRVPTIRVRFTTPDPTVQVFRAGQLMAPEDYERSVMLDPGSYDIVAKAPSGQQWTYSAVVNMGENVVVVIPPTASFGASGGVNTMGEGPVGGPGARPGGGPAGPGAGPVADQAEVDTARKAAPYIVTGAGVLSLGIGSFFGLQAISKNKDSQPDSGKPEACVAGQACPGRESAQSAATLSTVFFAIGGAAVVGGIVLFATTPSGPTASSAPAPGPAPAPGGDGFSRARKPLPRYAAKSTGLTVRLSPTLGGAFATGSF